jgi:hypothetical protein
MGNPTATGSYTGTLTATKARCYDGSINVTITVNDGNIINNSIAAKYKIERNSEIFINDSDTMSFNEVLIDLKKLSDDNGNGTNFVVEGTVDFGFLVDPNMDCHIAGSNKGDSININNVYIDPYTVAGIVIGRTVNTGT